MTITTRRPAARHPAPGRHRAQHRVVTSRRPWREAIAWRSCASVAWTMLGVAGATLGAIAIVLAAATRLSPAGQFTAFGHPVLIISATSMSPVLKAGDLIVDDPVTPAAASHLRAGLVASFFAHPGSSAIITRRIIAVITRHGMVRYRTKGDAASAADLTTRPAADVVGVVSYSIKGGGTVLTALRRPLVLGSLIGLPLLWLLAGRLSQLAITAGRACRRRRWPGAGWSRRAFGRPSAGAS